MSSPQSFSVKCTEQHPLALRDALEIVALKGQPLDAGLTVTVIVTEPAPERVAGGRATSVVAAMPFSRSATNGNGLGLGGGSVSVFGVDASVKTAIGRWELRSARTTRSWYDLSVTGECARNPSEGLWTSRSSTACSETTSLGPPGWRPSFDKRSLLT